MRPFQFEGRCTSHRQHRVFATAGVGVLVVAALLGDIDPSDDLPETLV